MCFTVHFSLFIDYDYVDFHLFANISLFLNVFKGSGACCFAMHHRMESRVDPVIVG